jgi:AraC family transcriptional regulator
LASVGSIALSDEPVVFGLLAEFERLDALSNGVEPIYAEAISSAIAHYLARKVGACRVTESSCALPPYKLRRVREFVAENLASRLSSNHMARLCDLSERHFHRAFKASTGRTPLEYVTAARIDHAKLLLASKTLSIADVAFAVGFANPSHFARTFAAATGVTPSAYRARSSVM